MSRILLGVTGSIAAYKAIELARLLGKAGHEVQVALTESAQRFVAPLSFEALTKRAVLTDLWTLRSHEIGHVERAYEAELLIVAPASANTLARLAHGLADDVLAATALSSRAPLLLAPAMETAMWEHPATQANVATLVARGARLVGPEPGELASGRRGLGRMSEPDAIAAAASALLSEERAWRGRRVLITAGPTIERLDPVRFLSNRSTGEMGIEIARAAARRGAEVRLVLGPTPLAPPAGVELVRVESAREMLAACEARVGGCDALVATAAVSDFRPAEARGSKLKRGDAAARTLALDENPDVLATLAARPDRPRVVVGFAAETEAVEANARDKLRRKGCDLVIGNLVGAGLGFGPGETSVIAVRADGPALPFGPASKPRVAEFVLDQLERALGEAKG